MARRDEDHRRRRKRSRSNERRDRGSSRRGLTRAEERLLRKAKDYVEREERKHRDKKRDRHEMHERDRRERDRHNKHASSRHDRDHHERYERDRHERDLHDRNDGHRHRHHQRRSPNDPKRRKDGDDSDRERKRDHSRLRKDKKRHRESSHQDKHRKEKKREKREDDGKRSKKRIKVKKSELFPLGDVRGQPPDALLDVEKDYFAYHQHLWVYLYREEGIAFGDLTSEEARDAFARFASSYNQGKLESAYYDKTIPSQALEESKTTTHSWSFKTNATERESLKFLEQGVRKQTEYEAPPQLPNKQVCKPARGKIAHVTERDRPIKTPQERAEELTANRRLREHVRAAEEEFGSGRKDYGRERQIEKRKQVAASIHGSAKDREAEMGGAELDDSALYGGGSGGEPSFQQALAREKQRKARRQEQRGERISQLQEKEQKRQAEMLETLGLTGIQPGQKITIAPRQDPE